MKTPFSFSFALGIFAATIFLSCKGPEGPLGPTGAKGDAGAQGAAGAQGQRGETGTANVIYTDWFSPNWTVARSTTNDYIFLNVARTETGHAILTQEAINKSAVFVYTKFTTVVYNSQDGEYQLVERITNQPNAQGYAKIPGRTTNNWADFHTLSCGHNNIGVNFFEPFAQLYNYDSATGKYVVIQEYVNKTAAEIRSLAMDMVKYRIVVIPGAVLSARTKSVDFSDYEAVKAAFEIKDF